MEEFDLSHALDIGIFRARLEYWTNYKYNPIRKSEWNDNGHLTTIDEIGTEKIHQILNSRFSISIPQSWIDLFKKELEFRQVDWDLLEKMDSVKVEIIDPVFYI